MKHWQCGKKVIAVGFGLALAAGSACAQQRFNAGWSGYVGDDFDADRVAAVAFDSQTNIFVGGFLGVGSIHNGSNISSLTENLGARDGFVAKLTTAGNLVWYLCLGQTENDSIMGLAVHTNGSVYAAGFSERVENDDSGTDARLYSIADTNGAVNWTSVSIGNHGGTNGFNAVAVDSNGYAYAVGYTTVPDLANTVPGYLVNGVTYGAQLKGSTDAFVVKYSPNGDIVWVCYLGGTNADAATACAVAPDGSVYVGGQTRSPGWVSLASGTPSPSNPDAFVVKLTANGTHVWSAFLGGSADDTVTALAKDPASSSLFIGGSTASSGFLSGTTRFGSYAGGTDGFVAYLTDSGAAFQTNWCRFFGGSTTDTVSSLAITAQGRLVVGGTTASGSWLTQIDASSFGGVQDGFLSLLAGDGSVVWSSYVGGARNDELRALASIGNTLLTVGNTFSPDWVSGGFWTTWSKNEAWYEDVGDFGFVAKWSSEPGIAPSVTDNPDDVTVNEGESATFRISAEGSLPLTYRWLRNGVIVTGTTSNAYRIASVATTNNNDTYSCLVSNYCGTATSQVARLTVIAKGALTVALSPDEALAQGAKWSLDGGATWLASGGSTNLPPGLYAVTFTNLTGWIAPAALSGLQVSSGATTSTSGVYTAVLPSAVRSITAWTNVSVTVRAPAGLSTWVLTETLAGGVTPANITAGGVWNDSTRTLTFTGNEATTNTFLYTAICTNPGVYTVSGTVTPHPANVPVAVTGDARIIKANFIRVISGQTVTVTVNQPSNVKWYAIEYMPDGLSYTNVTGPLSIDDSDSTQIYWTKKSVGTNLTYQVTGAPGTYTLSGEGQIGTGGWETIFGDTVITLSGSGGQGGDVPTPDILAFTPTGAGAFYLTFTSVVSQAYVILTNATVSATNAWRPYLSLSGQAGTTQQQVPMSGSNLFYRVRIQ
jgi:hypothetical protein